MSGIGPLKSGAMNDLHINGEFTATVTEDQDADGATTCFEGLREACVETGLIEDWEGLLDVTCNPNQKDVLCFPLVRMGMDLPVSVMAVTVPSLISRTRYCLNIGPSMV